MYLDLLMTVIHSVIYQGQTIIPSAFGLSTFSQHFVVYYVCDLFLKFLIQRILILTICRYWNVLWKYFCKIFFCPFTGLLTKYKLICLAIIMLVKGIMIFNSFLCGKGKRYMFLKYCIFFLISQAETFSIFNCTLH